MTQDFLDGLRVNKDCFDQLEPNGLDLGGHSSDLALEYDACFKCIVVVGLFGFSGLGLDVATFADALELHACDFAAATFCKVLDERFLVRQKAVIFVCNECQLSFTEHLARSYDAVFAPVHCRDQTLVKVACVCPICDDTMF